MRIGYFGDSVWGTRCLERLVNDGHEPVMVVLRTRPTDGSLEELAVRLGIAISTPRSVNEPEFIQRLQELEPELNISMSYDQILKRAIIDAAPKGFINCHCGMLPYYRGRSVINWALINNEAEIGLTVHYVDEGVDTGDIVLQESLPVGLHDDYGSVLSRVENAFPDIVSRAVGMIASGDVRPRVQRHLSGTYFSRRREGDEWIDWSQPSLRIYNKIRAISHPGPGARTLLGGCSLTIWRARYDGDLPSYVGVPGEVVGIAPGQGVFVKTGDSTLLIQSVQLDGEDEQAPALRVGTRLGIDIIDAVFRLRQEVRELRARFGAGEEERP